MANAKDTLQAADSLLLIVDVQERLASKIAAIEDILVRTRALIEAAGRLGVPVLFTQQYSPGLGATVPMLIEAAPRHQVYEKIHFDATKEADFCALVSALDRSEIVVAGTETHVCVLQTVLGLHRLGYGTWLCADAIGSRSETDRGLAVERISCAGTPIVSTEMVLFEWLERADTDAFRALLPSIRNLVAASGPA